MVRCRRALLSSEYLMSCGPPSVTIGLVSFKGIPLVPEDSVGFE